MGGDGGGRRPVPQQPVRSKAGAVTRIRLENFMCHSNLEIELGDWFNFITGQNGIGKSAILTALCVEFGCPARGTQRASTLKDFIKTGCRFNGNLRKKGISGQINISYEKRTLSIEVRMPQDASSHAVRDTRGLSGGERSFSTLCFALALHEMTEAPFRAMNEFDVFMDAVSRKISLGTLIDFALAHWYQWIFIIPHDISMVKPEERIKKQPMGAPRS